MISVLSGKPNPSTFPLTSVAIKARLPTGDELATEISGAALAEGLQYGPTAGLPALIKWVYGLQAREHHREQGEGWRLSIGSGSQDVIHKVNRNLFFHVRCELKTVCKAIFALVNPGDPVLVESPVYA